MTHFRKNRPFLVSNLSSSKPNFSPGCAKFKQGNIGKSSKAFRRISIKCEICGNAFNLCRRVFSKFCVIYECFWQTRKCCQSFRPEQLFFNEDVSRFSMFYGSKKPPEGKRSGVPKSFQNLLQFPHLYDSNQGLLWRFMALLKHAKKQQRNCVIKGGLKRGNYYLWGKLARP